VTARSLIAFIGALTGAIVVGPHGALLVAAPAPLTTCAAAVLIAIAYRGVPARPIHPSLVCGALVGSCIAAIGVPAVRAVEAHAPRGHSAGDLFDALDALDADPRALEQRSISVSGTWLPKADGWPASVSRRIMTCCAADAVDVGFDVAPHADVRLRAGSWVRVTGIVHVMLRDGDIRYEIADASVTPAIDR
jgi:hypothetical protein